MLQQLYCGLFTQYLWSKLPGLPHFSVICLGLLFHSKMGCSGLAFLALLSPVLHLYSDWVQSKGLRFHSPPGTSLEDESSPKVQPTWVSSSPEFPVSQTQPTCRVQIQCWGGQAKMIRKYQIPSTQAHGRGVTLGNVGQYSTLCCCVVVQTFRSRWRGMSGGSRNPQLHAGTEIIWKTAWRILFLMGNVQNNGGLSGSQLKTYLKLHDSGNNMWNGKTAGILTDIIRERDS